MLARYAWPEAIAALTCGAGLTLLAGWCGSIWLALPPGFLTAGLLWFYRDPPRRVTLDAEALLAPADGRIVEIDRCASEGGAARLRITIFLSVFDVHVNRAPCDGQVVRVDYRPGEFLSALRGEASRRNESNTLEISPGSVFSGPIFVRQIAGLLARRIVCRASAPQAIRQGQRFGMIKLGSRTELSVPADPRWVVCVRHGQRVRAGVTVLLRWKRGS